ncbi:MAG: hypothetical protein GY946_00030 [bacterium]|nr:hypothetical protein [bacterium]
MTIAEFVSAERTLELMEELEREVPEGSYRCDAVGYAVPGEDFHFKEPMRLHLG